MPKHARHEEAEPQQAVQHLRRSSELSPQEQRQLNYQLIEITKEGNISGIYTLIDLGADVDFMGHFDVSALYLAVVNKDKAAVEALLTAPAINPNLHKNRVRNPLETAIKMKHFEIAHLLMAAPQFNLESKNMFGQTVLDLATVLGETDLVDEIIALGADLKTTSTMGDMPIHTAAYLGHSKVIRHLLRAGTEPTIETTRNETALMIAERRQQMECAEILRSAPRIN